MPKPSKRKDNSLSKKNVEQIPQKSRKPGKTTKELVDDHIHDKDDIISDEAFKNVVLDLGIPGDEAHQPLPIPDKKGRPRDEDKDPRITTPWDVISE